MGTLQNNTEKAPPSGSDGGNWVYLLECADNTLYCGWTNALSHRLRMHREGKASKYTRARLPVRLVYLEEYPTKHQAMRREAEIKRLTRREKDALRRGWALPSGGDGETP